MRTVLLTAAFMAAVVSQISYGFSAEFTSPLSTTISGSQRAFPTAEGYGAKSTGARPGGTVCKVTSTANSGAGTLRDCLENQGDNLYVLILVNGIIDLTSNINTGSSNIYIAGQTSPSGWCLRGGAVNIESTGTDWIIRHYCAGRGDKATGSPVSVGDALLITSGSLVSDIIIDHSSMRWALDETMQLFDLDDVISVTDITVQHSIFAEPLSADYGSGTHALGPVLGSCASCTTGGVQRVSFHHNLITHGLRRMPRIGSALDVDVVNNIHYNWSSRAAHVVQETGRRPVERVNFINGVFRHGSNSSGATADDSALEIQSLNVAAHDYLLFFGGNEDEAGTGVTTVNERGVVTYSCCKATENTIPADAQLDSRQTAVQVWNTLRPLVGRTVPSRDSADTAFVADVTDGTGEIVECVDLDDTADKGYSGTCLIESSAGAWPTYGSAAVPTDTDGDGMPDIWERTHGLDKDDAGDQNLDMVGDGWTNLEYYLNQLALDYGIFESVQPIISDDGLGSRIFGGGHMR